MPGNSGKIFKTNVYTNTFNKLSVDQFSMFSPNFHEINIHSRHTQKSDVGNDSSLYFTQYTFQEAVNTCLEAGQGKIM